MYQRRFLYHKTLLWQLEQDVSTVQWAQKLEHLVAIYKRSQQQHA